MRATVRATGTATSSRDAHYVKLRNDDHHDDLHRTGAGPQVHESPQSVPAELRALGTPRMPHHPA